MKRNISKKGIGAQRGDEKIILPGEIITETETLEIDINPEGNGHYGEEAIPMAETEAETADRDKQLKVAILSEDGFEEVELTAPKQALEDAGIAVDVVSPHDGTIKGWDKTNWGHEVPVDKALRQARPAEYDAIILPGGVMNPDKLRQNRDAVAFLKRFIITGKPVAAICHGAQTLIETGMIQGSTMTSYPSLKTDLLNAGVWWVDRPLVHSGQFITSRKPADLDSFNRELIHTLTLQVH